VDEVPTTALVARNSDIIEAMKIRILLPLIISLLCFSIEAKDLKILILDSQSGEPYNTLRSHLLKSLNRLGYKQGKNLRVEHHAIGNYKGMVKNIWKLEYQKNYDVVVVSGTIATVGMKEAAFKSKQKVIFMAPTDPVGIGVISNFTEGPASNFTGVCYPVKAYQKLKFLKRVFPKLKKIGYIYTSMPQSISYLNWLKKAIKSPEFKGIELITRQVPFVKSDKGHIRMARIAKKYVQELDSSVDLFLSPTDQMGTQRPFAEMVYQTASKPLVGVGRKDVMKNWGATMSIYSLLENIAYEAAVMIDKVNKGVPLWKIKPKWPKTGIAFDQAKMKKFKVKIPKSIKKYELRQ